MSDITNLGVGDYINARVFYRHVNNPDEERTTTHEFRSNAIAPSPAARQSLVDKLVAFHKALLHVEAVIMKVVLSTHEAEEGGYDPLSFITYNVNEAGLRPIPGQPLSADIVLHVQRNVETGRSGKFHLRHCLNESDIYAPGGKLALQNEASVAAEVAAANLTSGLKDTMTSGTGGQAFQMVMVSTFGVPPVQVGRFVVDLELGGVRDTDPNHRYYDVP